MPLVDLALDGFEGEVEWIDFSPCAGLEYGHEKALSVGAALGLISVAVLPDDDGGPDVVLGPVVGGRNLGVGNEGEDSGEVIDHSLGEALGVGMAVFDVGDLVEPGFEALSRGIANALLVVASGEPDGVANKIPKLAFERFVFGGDSVAVLVADLVEFAHEMSEAELVGGGFAGSIGSVEVANESAVEASSEDVGDDPSRTTGIDEVEHFLLGAEAPHPMRLAVDAPPRLVGVKDASVLDLRADLSVDRGEKVAEAEPRLGERSRAHRQFVLKLQQLDDLRDGDAVLIVLDRRHDDELQTQSRLRHHVRDDRFDSTIAILAEVLGNAVAYRFRFRHRDVLDDAFSDSRRALLRRELRDVFAVAVRTTTRLVQFFAIDLLRHRPRDADVSAFAPRTLAILRRGLLRDGGFCPDGTVGAL